MKESPKAFASQLDDEERRTEADWRRTFIGATWMVAIEGRRVIGLARSVRDRQHPWMRHVESIWVEPRYRRTGVTRSLLRVLAEIERQVGVSELFLWVLDGNHDARRVYEQLGFVATGERQPLPDDTSRYEERLRLRITERPRLR